MAELTIVTPEELAEREQKLMSQGRSGRRRSAERTRIIEEYKAAMQRAVPGYGADVLLADGEDKKQVRQNLKAAAAELNIALEFRPIKDKTRIYVRFITLDEHAAKPKRGGRPPRQRARESVTAEGGSEGAQTAAPEAVPGDTQPAIPRKRRTRTSTTAK